MNGSSSSTLDGQIFPLGPVWSLCRFRLPTSMPIPLAVTAPGDIELVTWAFAGMKAPAHRPTCLLLLRAHGAVAASALTNGTSLVVATHFCDIAVSTAAAEVPDALSPDERDVVARALLSSVTAATVAALADPIAHLAPALRAFSVPKEAPDLAITADCPGTCTLSGTDVPNYILFESEAGTRCARVAAARVTVAAKPRMDLDLEPIWGPQTGAPAHALLVGDREFTAARLRSVGA